ncbi:MAG: leucine-rich repeat protein [Clostridia bacterium]|nr:leucine-rich repeat protein [Clostridia bacterium]
MKRLFAMLIALCLLLPAAAAEELAPELAVAYIDAPEEVAATKEEIVDDDGGLEPAVDEVTFELGGEEELLLPSDGEEVVPEDAESAPLDAQASDFVIQNGMLTKYQGPGGDVVIPDGVTVIGPGAFSGCESVTRVTIPRGVTTIGFEAFCACFGVTELVLPDTVVTIGGEAFADMENLTRVVMPEGVEYIGDWAFSRCYSLTDLSIPASVTYIGEDAFRYCVELTVGVAAGSYAEQYCIDNEMRYKYTNYAEGVLREGDGWSLIWTAERVGDEGVWLDIRLDGSNERDGTIFIYNEFGEDQSPWLGACDGFTRDSFTLVTVAGCTENPLYIPTELFRGYAGLREVDLLCVENIGSYAFADCPRLRRVNGFDDYLHFIERGAFKNCTALEDVTQNWDGWVVYPTNLRTIGSEAFYNDSSLEKLFLYPSVTSIGDDAFYGCRKLMIFCDNKNAIGYKYAVEHGIKCGLMAFEKGRDAWQFRNSDAYFGPTGEGSYLNSRDKAALFNGLSETERNTLERQLKEAWGGSCYGMSVTAVLNKWGSFAPSELKPGAANLHDVTKANNDDVESFINFHQWSWMFRKHTEAVFLFDVLGMYDKIDRIWRLAQSAEAGDLPFVLEMELSGNNGGHAVVGYGMEMGSFKYKGKQYDTKVLLYDPTFPDHDSALYCNYQSADFAVVDWDVADFQYAGSVRDEIDPAITGKDKSLVTHLYYFLPPKAFSVTTGGDTITIDDGTCDAGKGIFVAAMPDGDSDARLLYFMNGDTDFTIHPQGGADFTYSADSGLYDVTADGAKDIAFTKDGGVSMTDVTGAYSIVLTVDEDRASTPWTQTRVTGRGGDIAIAQAKDGLVIAGEDLSGVTVVAANDVGESLVALDGGEKSVLVTGGGSSGQPAPAVYADGDGDGVYETQVAAAPEIVVVSTSSVKHTVELGKKLQISLPEQAVTGCYSAKPAVATVTSAGLVTPVAAGTAKITVPVGKKKRTLTLTVVDPAMPTKLRFAEASLTLDMGTAESLTLKPILEPVGTARSDIEWKSSSAKVATVDQSGVVRPLKTGSVTITATAKKNKKAKGTVKLKIIDSTIPTKLSLVDMSGAALTGTVEQDYNATLQIGVRMQPDNAVSDITWKSSSSKIAEVDANGLVKPVKVGTVTITATSVKNKSAKASVKLKIVDPTMPTQVVLTDAQGNALPATLEIDLLDAPRLIAQLLPAGTAQSDIAWKSSSDKIATVDANGNVKPVKAGSVTITATATKNKKAAKVKLKIADLHAPTALTVSAPAQEVAVGGRLALTVAADAKRLPVVTTYTWTSGSKGVATVDGSGVVTGVKPGKAKITVTAANKKKATYTVIVK